MKNMLLYKENKLDKRYVMPNKEVAEKFMKSTYYSRIEPIGKNLVLFISMLDGLNSTWDFNSKLGSIYGNVDMLNIIDIIKGMEKC